MTHVNAFYGAVDLAKAKVVAAKGELQAAEAALKAHSDYVEPEEEKQESDTKVSETKKDTPKKK